MTDPLIEIAEEMIRLIGLHEQNLTAEQRSALFIDLDAIYLKLSDFWTPQRRAFYEAAIAAEAMQVDNPSVPVLRPPRDRDRRDPEGPG